ncbi:MAG: hypothetical protein IJY58_03315 [Alphaproteobacteria bacterium]|nr:hypothetical protein [Alphaproteobacteria bacterium]
MTDFQYDKMGTTLKEISHREYVQLLLKRRAVHYQAVHSFLNENGLSCQNDTDIVDLCVQACVTADVFNSNTPEQILNNLKPYLSDKEALKKTVRDMGKKAQIYRQELFQSRRVGKLLRRQNNPVYPNQLEQGRLYIQINPIHSLQNFLQHIVVYLNKSLPQHEQLSLRTELEKTTTFFWITQAKKEQRTGRFLRRLRKDINQFIDEYQQLSLEKKEAFYHQLYHTISPEYILNYPDGHQTVNCIKQFNQSHGSKFAVDSILYYQIRSILKDNPSPQYLIDNLNYLSQELKLASDMLSFQQVTQPSRLNMVNHPDIDLLIFSKEATDLSLMAAYTDFDEVSCMNPTDVKHLYVTRDIGHGSIVVYGVNSQNPHKRLMRILLKPCHSATNDTVYSIGKIYGPANLAFVRAVTDYTRTHFDRAGNSQKFVLHNRLYTDNVATVIYRSSLDNHQK